MSRPSIKFIYSGEIRSSVQQMQRGPVRLENLYDSFMRPEYVQIPKEASYEQNGNYPPVISNMEINSKPMTPSSMTRYRSADNFNIGRNEQQFRPASPTLNIEEINESEVKMMSQKQQEPKKISKNTDSEQIVLKAPSYKFTPRREGEIAVHSKKECKKTTSVGKCLNGESTLKSKKPIRNSNADRQVQLKSSNPVLKVEAVKESDFLKQIPKPPKSGKRIESNSEIEVDQIVLKAPKYKYTPRQEGDIVVNRKKEYVKAENTEKYLYEGIQKHQENDFIGCFGCGKPQPKVYAAEEEEE